MQHPIFTLNARSHVLLEVVRDEFGLSDAQMHAQIQALHQSVIDILASKGVQYVDLKTALVPRLDRMEAAFLFDWQLMGTSYGYEAWGAILPLVDATSNQSFLLGDLRSVPNRQADIDRYIRDRVVAARPSAIRRTDVLYAAYLNGLTPAALARLHGGLSAAPGYVGYIDATYSSPAKTYLSTTLANFALKNGKKVILPHEDDVPNEENHNLSGYPFEENGFKLLSLQEHLFSIFLGYKIERAVYPGFEVDTELALNAVTPNVLPLEDFAIQLDAAKHAYLTHAKQGKLEMAGLADVERADLAELIRTKMMANYIYNLHYSSQHNVVKFNIVLEVPHPSGHPTRLIAALEYKPSEKVLRVITFY